jgi:hypothetical protein
MSPTDMNDTRTASFLCHFSFWFGVAFATPVFIALHNQQDIVLSAAQFSLWAGLVCLLLSALGWKLTELAGSRAQWWVNRILLTLAFAAAIQGNIVHDLFYYGAFNGSRVDFRDYGFKFWAEWWGFLLAIAAGFVLLTRLKRVPGWLPAIPVLSFLFLLLPAWLASASEAPDQIVDEAIDPAVFAFSNKANLIHLLADGMQGDVVREVLELNPELAEKFEGFTLFNNHVGLYQGTGPAMYTLLTGEPFELDKGFSYKRVTPIIQEKAYQKRLLEQGYRLDYVPISRYVCIEEADSCNVRPFNDMKARGLFRHHSEDAVYSLRLIADLTMFRLTPMFLKEKIYAAGHWFMADTTLDGSSPWPDPVIREWTENLYVIDDQPVYKWYHFLGTHMPAKWDAECRLQGSFSQARESYKAQAFCVLNGIALFLDRLKQAGIYDQTAFVISGDHGHNIYPDDMSSPPLNHELYRGLLGSGRPALLVKEMNSRAPLRISQSPTSLLDVAPTALALTGIDTAQQSAFEFTESRPRERFFTPYSIADLYTGNAIPYSVFEVGQFAQDGEQWILTDIKSFSKPPAEYDPVNFNTATGYMLGAALNREKPNQDNSWVGGRRLGFLIDISESIRAPSLELTLQLPEWIPTQSFTVQVNGSEIAGNYLLSRSEGDWQTISVPLDKELIKPGRNFITFLFERTFSPPGNPHWQASAQIRSIKVYDLRHQ